MDQEMPITNDHLPANHQDAGDIPTIAPDSIDFGVEEFSPPPIIRESARVQGEMNFYEALKKVADGHRVTRISWSDSDCYACMHDSFLYLKESKHKESKTQKFNAWGISEGDMMGTDWVTL